MRAKRTIRVEPLPRWRRVARALGRIALVAAFLGLVAGGWAYHPARAQLRDNLFGLGTQMMASEHASRQDAPRDLVVNGQTIHLSSGTTTRPAREVLDYFEERCARADGGLVAELDRLVREHPEGATPARPGTPTMREDDGRNGFVACLDLGAAPVCVAELVERLGRFGETGDVSVVGDARFVFAEQLGEGAETRTHFVGLWTEGEFNVLRMFPEQGDAPGADVDGVARPPGARRVLSGHERGMPSSITVYETRLGEAELDGFYRRELGAAGWTFLETAARPSDAPATLVAERGERMVTLIFSPDLVNGGSQAAIFDGR